MTEAGETQRQFGQRVGLSQGRVTQLVKQGLPLLPSGRIDVEGGLRWLEQNLDHTRSARAKAAIAEPWGGGGAEAGEPPASPAPAARATVEAAPLPRQPSRPEVPPSPPSSPPTPPAAGGVTMAEARRQHELVRVASARLRFEKERGKLISKDDVKVYIFSRSRKERNAHLAWIMRVSPLMAVDLQVDPTLMFSVLDRYIREHLNELAQTPLLELPEP